MRHVICGPVESFTNHIRWLLIMSPEYSAEFIKYIPKLNYVNDFVYGNKRSFYNWFLYESKFHRQPYLQNLIYLDYRINSIKNDVEQKIIFPINIDINLALKYNLKFNPKLNNLIKSTIDDPEYSSDMNESILLVYKNFIENENKTHTEYIPKDNEQVLTVDSTKLANKILDVDLYNSLINFFNITSNYEEAAKIHSTWFDLNQSLELKMKESYEQFCDDWVWQLPNLVTIPNSNLPEKPGAEELLAIKNLMKKVYS